MKKTKSIELKVERKKKQHKHTWDIRGCFQIAWDIDKRFVGPIQRRIEINFDQFSIDC